MHPGSILAWSPSYATVWRTIRNASHGDLADLSSPTGAGICPSKSSKSTVPRLRTKIITSALGILLSPSRPAVRCTNQDH